MAQHDYDVANQTFPATRADLNSLFSAIRTLNSGATAPSSTSPYMFWLDTTEGILKQRNAGDSAWSPKINPDNDMVVSKTSTFTLAANEFDKIVLCDATGGAVTANLLTASGREGFRVVIVKSDASTNAVTLDGNGAETISGSATLVLGNRWDAVMIVSDGTNWIATGRYSTTSTYMAGLLASADASTARTNLGIPTVLAAQPIGFRNAVDNAKMEVAQPGTSFTGVSAFTHLIDRWYGWCFSGGSNATMSQVAAPSGTDFNYCLRVQRPNANTSVQEHAVGTVIISERARRYAGKSAVLSFWARSGANFSAASGNITVRVAQSASVDQGSSARVAGTWTSSSLALAATNQAITSTLTRYSFNLTFSAGINQIAIEIYFKPVGTAGVDDWFEITGVELDEGSILFPFEHVPFQQELQKAQYHYEKSFEYGTAPAQNAGQAGAIVVAQIVGASATQFGGSIPYKSTKRVIPAVTFFNPAAANGQVRNLSTSADCSGVALNSPGTSTQQIQFQFTTAAGSSAGNFNAVHYVADARL